MTPKYKLIYFDVQGLGECIRFLLNYGGIEFEDVRLRFENWAEKRTEISLFGQLPILEVDGKAINQSAAISRYLAKKVKLAGNDEWEDLEIDAIVDTQVDMRVKFSQFFLEKDEERKAAYKNVLLNEVLPFYLARFEKIVGENGGYFALGRLTWADLHFVSLLDTFIGRLGVNILANYPNLQSLKDKVQNIPAIKSWIAKRPAQHFPM